MRSQFEEDNEDSNTVEVGSYADMFKFTTSEKNPNDPFNVDAEEIKKMSGLSPAFRRKLGREMTKAFVGADGAKTQQTMMAQAISGYALLDLIEPTYNLEYLSRLYEISTYNYSACNAKTANIIGLGYSFIETRKTNDALDGISDNAQLERARRKIARLKQDLESWLDGCNQEDHFMDTLTKVWTDYEATGNAYIEVGRTTRGDIGYIGHIPSKTMRVRRVRDGFVQLLYGKLVFFRNFGDQETPNPIAGAEEIPNEIIHLKKYTPVNMYYGIPDIIAAQIAMVGNEFSGKYNLDYFENKAVPRYIITVKGAKLSPESERKLLEFFEVGLKGKSHRSLYVPLPPDTAESRTEFKMEPVENGIQESSFNQYRKMNRDEILIAHRVPVNKIGTPEGVNLAVARDADKTFKEQVCRPAQAMLEKRLNQIFAEKTDALIIKFNELSLTDEDTQSKIDERYLRMQVIVPNEVRLRKGMIPLEGGDDVVELKPQQAADQQATAGKTRARDSQRSANATDSAGEGRNAKGDGPKSE